MRDYTFCNHGGDALSVVTGGGVGGDSDRKGAQNCRYKQRYGCEWDNAT
jgi:hypothetical protein